MKLKQNEIIVFFIIVAIFALILIFGRVREGYSNANFGTAVCPSGTPDSYGGCNGNCPPGSVGSEGSGVTLQCYDGKTWTPGPQITPSSCLTGVLSGNQCVICPTGTSIYYDSPGNPICVSPDESCYGASTGICETCDDVKAAYAKKNWDFDPSKIAQCKGQNSTPSPSPAPSQSSTQPMPVSIPSPCTPAYRSIPGGSMEFKCFN